MSSDQNHRSYNEPSRFETQDQYLDNFGDLAKKQMVKEKGINAEELDFDIELTVNITDINDLVCAIEQDYYLNKILMPKMHYLVNDKQQLDQVLLLVNRYLSASHLNCTNAQKIKKQSLSRINLL